MRPQDVLGVGQMDFVVRGEGEYIFRDLLSCIAEGIDPSRVDGVSWHRSDGTICHNVPAALIRPLDSLPIPALDLLRAVETYRPLDMGLMITERGCPSKCTFCGLHTLWEHKVRYHSIDRVIDEIVMRKNLYRTEYFSFRNGTFTLSRKRIKELCSRLASEKLGIQWECLTRVDQIDREILALMRDVGCVTIRVGMESGSQRILDYMQKDITLAQSFIAAELLNESGIHWSAYFMIGVPQEDEVSIRSTMDFMVKADPPFISLGKFTPLPGTEMYQECVRAGMLDEISTDWTWSLNQDLEQFFVANLSQEQMRGLMVEALQFVDMHNRLNKNRMLDRREK